MKFNQQENKIFWDKKAKRHTGHLVSWWDINMKKIEIATISKLINKNDYVLDVGCSNGESTVALQRLTKAQFFGIDYSKPAITQAKKIKNRNLEFHYQNILKFKTKITFDKAISIRVIINLMDFNSQKKAIVNIHGALKPRGVYIMAEGFKGGLDNLNRARINFGLKILPEPVHNIYLRERTFENFIKKYFYIKKIIRHGSLYYLGTRLFQYLAFDEDPIGKDTILHRFFGKFGNETKHSGDFSPNKVYVLIKK